MLEPTLRQYAFVHRFVEAVTWQPLRKALATRPSSRAAIPREGSAAWEHVPRRAA